MLAVPNRLQKANGWSFSSQLWHPPRLRCDCPSNSCRKRSGDSKHPCRSPYTNGERSWFNSPDTDTNFWAGIGYSDLTASNRRPSTPYSRNSPHSFSREPGRMLLDVDKTCVPIFGILPRFIKHLLESENLGCSPLAGTKTALGIIQLWLNYFAASFFKALGNVNVNYLKIPEKHRGPHKTPSRASCCPRVWDPCCSCMYDQLLMWHNAAYSVYYTQREGSARLWNARAYSRSTLLKVYTNITL